MVRSIFGVAITAMIAAPAAAQEFTPMNPADFSRPLVMHSTIDAQAKRARGGRSAASEARATCANIPTIRARWGADDHRVQRLTRMCRQAGLY